MIEKIRYHTVWKITKSDKNGVYEVMEFEGNLLLNEGIAAWSDGGLTTYPNAATYIGVGDSDTAAAATQTGLQAASNRELPRLLHSRQLLLPTRQTSHGTNSRLGWQMMTLAQILTARYRLWAPRR